MKSGGMLVDTYTFKARLLPVLLVLVPVSLVIWAWFPSDASTVIKALGVLSPMSFVMILAQLPRDRGKRLERELIEKWGGSPTLAMLRYRTTSMSKTTLRRYHTQLAESIPGISMLTEHDERASPEEADDRYRSCIDYLREHTRDTTKFDLVFAENVSYGYRRNLVGMKPFGLWFSVGGLIGCAGALTFGILTKSLVQPLPLVGSAVCLALMLLWIFAFNEQWVRTSADAYAQRLLEACESIKDVKSSTEMTVQ